LGTHPGQGAALEPGDVHLVVADLLEGEGGKAKAGSS
jgi:hypothetical protein